MIQFVKVAAALLVVAMVGLAAATWLVSRPASDERVSPETLRAHEIIAPDRALTFARTAGSDGLRVLAVRSWVDGTVTAIDVTAAFDTPYRDPAALLESEGRDAVVAAAARLPSAPYRAAELVTPLELESPHIATGTNYRAHAKEVMLDGEPFLFPKLSEATTWAADVAAATRLDYEAEICVIPLRYLSRAEIERADPGAPLGYLLCNDFTDRALLVQLIDLDRPMGVTGFADAKGGASHLPVGPLLVVPHDGWDFYRDVELALYVDGRLRQRSAGALMVWPPREIMLRALAACDRKYLSRGGELSLTPCDGIAAGTLILTGTPSGVIFHPVNVWYWGLYLQPGDHVITTGRYLGLLDNRITPQP